MRETDRELSIEGHETLEDLRKQEIRAQATIDLALFDDNMEAWNAGWIENGLSALFRDLIEGPVPDQTLIRMLHEQPADPRSPAAQEWANAVYHHVLTEQRERNKNG